MGNLLSSVVSLFNSKQNVRLLILGLDGAGKTTILYRLKIAETITTIPTIGFNVENVVYKNLNFTMWDVGGQLVVRQLWRHYYQNTNGIIFVVDSSDRERLEEAKNEIHQLMVEDSLREIPLLVLANKQDSQYALKIDEMVEGLKLNTIRDRKWWIQPTSATRGEGIYEGLEFLSKAL